MARSSDPFRGMLKKTASLRQGYGRQASCVPSLRRSGFAQAGRAFGVLTYSVYAPRAKSPAALLDGRFQPSLFSVNSPTIRLTRSKHLTQTSTASSRSLISDRLLGDLESGKISIGITMSKRMKSAVGRFMVRCVRPNRRMDKSLTDF